jgi:hypothetical protein
MQMSSAGNKATLRHATGQAGKRYAIFRQIFEPEASVNETKKRYR